MFFKRSTKSITSFEPPKIMVITVITIIIIVISVIIVTIVVVVVVSFGRNRIVFRGKNDSQRRCFWFGAISGRSVDKKFQLVRYDIIQCRRYAHRTKLRSRN